MSETNDSPISYGSLINYYYTIPLSSPVDISGPTAEAVPTEKQDEHTAWKKRKITEMEPIEALLDAERAGSKRAKADTEKGDKLGG